MAASLFSCKKEDDNLPPNWYYELPDIAITQDVNIGAYYIERTAGNWATTVKDHPVLNNEEMGSEGGYVTASDGIISQQCQWADMAGVDFFIFPWNNTTANRNLISLFSRYREDVGAKVKIAVNFSFSQLTLGLDEASKLTGSGAKFDLMVTNIKALYRELISKDYYYHLPDGRPVMLLNGDISAGYDYALFMPAFRAAMAQFLVELRAEGAEVSDNALNFYFIGEVSGNWIPPQRNQDAGRHLNGNFCKQWYPAKYYERWYAFYSFTDIAWQNWAEYAKGWGNDFVPCIFPEYYVTASGSRSIERSEHGYQQFCNVAKKNLGKNRVVIINSWNDFATASALEPATEYGETYLNMTRKNFKVR